MKHTSAPYRSLAIAMALLSNACYTYGSSGLATRLIPDAKVAARLTARGTVNYEPRIGPDVERVEGVLARTAGDSVELRVQKTLNRNGDWMTWGGEPVTFNVNDFAAVGQRRLSRGKTALALAGLAAVVTIIFRTDLLGFGGGPSSSDPRPIPPGNPG
jgi:hypothetical protein